MPEENKLDAQTDAQNDLGAQAAAGTGTESNTADGQQPGGAQQTPAAGAKEQPAAEPAKAQAPAAELDTDKLKMPQGFKLEGEALGRFKEFAGRHKLDAQYAQELVDYHAGELKKTQDAFLAQGQKLVDDWKAQTQELYRGMNAAAELAFVNKALDGIAVEGLKEELTQSGFIHNPKIQAALNKLGREVFSSDAFIKGTVGAKAERVKGDLSALYNKEK
jgi:hypothetical protein